MLIEQTTVPASALPIVALKEHLRLGTGFADDGVQDGLLEAYLRAAIAAIEGRIGKALLARVFSWSVTGWREAREQALPIAPVTAIQAVTLVDRGGVETVVDAGRYRLVKDAHRPRLMAVGPALPGIPPDGTAEVVFEAGFGPGWADIPADLAQAVLLLAAQYHERRHEGGPAEGTMPFGVMALIERWRTVRVLGGGAV